MNVKTFSFHALPRRSVFQGFDNNLHTIHLGRIEPEGYLVQVTEDSINIVRPPSSGSGVFESAASWRPPPPPPPPLSSLSSCSPFKVQHAGTAGKIVAVVCDSTMVVAEVQEVTPLAPALQPSRAVGGEGSPDVPMVEVNEAWRGGLDGGSVSALGVRLLGSGNGIEEGLVGEQGLGLWPSLRGSNSRLLQSHCWSFTNTNRPLQGLYQFVYCVHRAPATPICTHYIRVIWSHFCVFM